MQTRTHSSGVMVIESPCPFLMTEMDTVTRFQILDEAICISHHTKTLGKGINPIIFLPTMCK